MKLYVKSNSDSHKSWTGHGGNEQTMTRIYGGDAKDHKPMLTISATYFKNIKMYRVETLFGEVNPVTWEWFDVNGDQIPHAEVCGSCFWPMRYCSCH